MQSSPNGYPENPILVRVWRGGEVESVHRGAWVLVDAAGEVLEGAGSYTAPVFVRSSVKALQALPLFETGAAERFDFADQEIALALASHNGEPCHTNTVQGTLARLGLGVGDLCCGPQSPGDRDTRQMLLEHGDAPTALHNNCSGKHAGFLALALHLGVPPERYLDPESEGQRLVRDVLAETCDRDPKDLVPAVDGCSAPTYRMPLTSLATAFARITNPEGLTDRRRDHFRRMTDIVARHPILIAGSSRRLDTDLVAATGGRLFPKVGAEAVYAIGECAGDRGLAIKVDDGGNRGLHALVLALAEKFGLLQEDELAALARWKDTRLKNLAGLEVGRVETLLP